MDQYLASLNEIESRLIASEKWIDVPVKEQDYTHLNLMQKERIRANIIRHNTIRHSRLMRTSRSVAFMLNREDGMGSAIRFL